MNFRVGLIGGGSITETHARAARAIPGVEIAAICGSNSEKVHRLCREHGGTPYLELSAFLTHRPMDLVIIGSPSGLHANQGIAAAKHGLHLLTEKPIDISTKSADALIEVTKQAGVKLGVIFQDRMKPHIRQLKDWIARGLLGKPLLVDARVNWYRPPDCARRLPSECVPTDRWGLAGTFTQGAVPLPSLRRLTRSTAILIALALTGLFFLKFAGQSQEPGWSIQHQEDPNAAKRMTVLLKDFEPRPMLHVAAHDVPRARFPVIDVHNHVNDATTNHGDQVPPADVVRVMDQANVNQVVILTGMWGDKLQSVIDKMVKQYPDRFLVFTQFDWSKVNDPNFSQEMVEQLDDAVRRGARGLKVLKDLGLGVKDKSGKLLPVDDPRLDPVWEECGKLGIPVAIHTSDPEAFFLPTDEYNERYEELMHNPTWSFFGPQFPSKLTLLEQRNHVIAKHPRTTFIALHVANWPENLDAVSAWLDQYPNMYVELGAREAELGRQPRRARKLFLNYQERILFGTDSDPDEKMYANYFRWLETADEYFDYWGYPEQGRWHIYGMELPDGVLEKVYNKNAQKIFSQFKGKPEGSRL